MKFCGCPQRQSQGDGVMMEDMFIGMCHFHDMQVDDSEMLLLFLFSVHSHSINHFLIPHTLHLLIQA